MILIHPILGPLKKEVDDIIYIVSDLHLNHQKEFLWGGRSNFINSNNELIKFNSAEEYSEYILNELRELALYHKNRNEKAYLISLGDNSFTDKDKIWIEKFISLPFEHIFTLGGNHTSGLKDVLTDNKWTYKNLTLLSAGIVLSISKKKHIILSHFPIMDWDQHSYGCLCGHCHGNNPVLNADNSSFGRIFDCGVENALKLYGRCYLSIDECIQVLETKNDINEIQWHRTNQFN